MFDGEDQIYQGPNGTALRFYERPSKNNFQSERLGRPVFDTSLLVEVMVPGSRESTPEFEVERRCCEEAGTAPDGGRITKRGAKYDEYKAQIEAYKSQNGEGLAKGTPLSQWPQIDAGTAATMRAAGIHSVEMLAAVQDGHLQNLGMGGHVLRSQAQAFLQTRQFGVPSAQMAAETARLAAENTRLQAENSQLRAALDARPVPSADAVPDAPATETIYPDAVPVADPANIFATPPPPPLI